MIAESRKRSRRKALSKEDKALWQKVTATLTPIKANRAAFVEALEEQVTDNEPATAAKASPVKDTKKQQLNGVSMPSKPTPPPLPPLAPMAKRERRKVVRGRGKPIDARIDLHGMTQHQAHDRLRGFLYQSQASGHSLVLVITGKGASPDSAPYGDMRGVLRRMVPQWLSLPDFRSFVVGFEQAHASHGGEGALYVRIRRRKGVSGDYS
ncbi:Smr/MutS family protein [Pseudovibrio sp. SPO723]|uniref:Smr/MutS family protein n=1 Tax=Nesiotobacter zosterae TaxID=392721 RepID=UPI0029C5B416|nr:Smr/MutS family protein [Pseudovibrio sp. SPO723]MDX5595087.1 Smr/MutS family protein [Pseudovibrio sp. SPO723]